MAQGGLGNTSQSTKRLRVRNWCYTLYEDEPITNDNFKYHIYQQEKCPTTTNLHFQGFFILKEPKEFKVVKKMLGDRVHLEEAKGNIEQNKKYCTKEDSRIAGPWEYGSIEDCGKGARTDVNKIKKMCKENKSLLSIVEQYPEAYIKFHNGIDKLRALYSMKRDPNESVEVIVYYGEPGCGKSRKAYENNPNAFYKDPSTKWWDGYDGEKTVIIDDFEGEIDYRVLLRWLDRYPTTIEVKGSVRQLLATKFIITSNIEPERWYRNGEALLRRITSREEITCESEP